MSILPLPEFFMRLALSIAVCISPLVSRLSAQQPQGPSCSGAEHRQFDFWVGAWEVTDSAGRTVYGTNNVTREEDGCLIHEHWVGSRGGTGQSLNFFDPLNHGWKQAWVGNDGLVLLIAGGLSGMSMVLEGEALGPSGTALKQRATWTPQPDGRVRQFWEQSPDGGKTWTVAFDGWYRRRSA